jgi:hypothetical protein
MKAAMFEAFEEQYVRPKPGRTLIVGSKIYATRSDRRQLHSNALGIDMLPGEGVDYVWNLEQPPPDELGYFDHIECLSVLEHSKRPWALAKNVIRMLVRGGTFFIAVPFVWRVHAYPDDYWRFSTSAVRSLFPDIAWVKLCYANTKLTEDFRIPNTTIDEQLYFMRTEVYGFGHLS